MLSAPAFAGEPEPQCTATIEINALRGGSPTVSADSIKNITSKARIAKGTGDSLQTLEDTTLTIEAYVNGVLEDTQVSTDVITLVVGKGGQGDKLGMVIGACPGGRAVEFIATFEGTDSIGGGICTQASAPLMKSCK